MIRILAVDDHALLRKGIAAGINALFRSAGGDERLSSTNTKG